MKKTRILFIALCFLMLGVAPKSFSATVHLAPSSTSVNAGTSFEVSIYTEDFDQISEITNGTENGVGLIGVAVDLYFDPSLFEYAGPLSPNVPTTPPWSAVDIKFPSSSPPPSDHVEIFAYNFFTPIAVDFSLPTVTFNCLGSGTGDIYLKGHFTQTDGLGNFQLMDEAGNLAGFVNETQIQYDTITISQVPIPATALLFLSGIFGLVGIKRFKGRKLGG